ncbi:MAG: hypothetical protein WBQ10_06215, partial [Terriglobales bacterium]
GNANSFSTVVPRGKYPLANVNALVTDDDMMTQWLRGYILSGTQRHVWRFKSSDLDAMLSVPAVLSTDGRIK